MRKAERMRLGGLVSYRDADIKELTNLASIYQSFFNTQVHTYPRTDLTSQAIPTSNLFDFDSKMGKPSATEIMIGNALTFKLTQERSYLTADCESLANMIYVSCDQRLEKLPSEELIVQLFFFMQNFNNG